MSKESSYLLQTFVYLLKLSVVLIFAYLRTSCLNKIYDMITKLSFRLSSVQRKHQEDGARAE